jgi:hypothetical protein
LRHELNIIESCNVAWSCALIPIPSHVFKSRCGHGYRGSVILTYWANPPL